jgi:hypothetical protein
MTQRKTFIRKIIYMVAIAVLLVPISYLSRPAARKASAENVPEQAAEVLPGGTLARLRDEYKISQANLGEIDPTSVAARLSTLGLNGIAAAIYWQRANEYKMMENWTEYENALDEISKMQPNFISVWKYQAWNLSYNVSVEFDDFNTRYLWVKKGIRFLIKGAHYNDTDERLPWEVGWFLNQKIGKSDEHDQYRRLFKRDMRDDDRGGDRAFRSDMPFSLDDCEDPRGERDNWLVGHQWYARAQRMVDEQDSALNMHPAVFHSSVPMSAIKYAAVLVEDGIFDRDGEPIRQAWRDAERQWNDFGNRVLISYENIPIRLNDLEQYRQDAEKIGEQIAKLEAEGEAADRAALRSLKLEKSELDKKADYAKSYRDVVNFEYWRRRCQYEQMREATDAHRFAYEARQAFERGEFVKAGELYEQSFKNWRIVLDQFPEVVKQTGTLSDAGGDIEQYQQLLEQLELPLPRGFILQDVIDAGQGEG